MTSHSRTCLVNKRENILQSETRCTVIVLFDKCLKSPPKLENCVLDITDNRIIATTTKRISIQGKDLRSSSATNVYNVLHVGSHRVDLLILIHNNKQRETTLNSINKCRGISSVSEQHFINISNYVTLRYPSDSDNIINLVMKSIPDTQIVVPSSKLPFPITLQNRVGIHKRPKGTKLQRWYRDLEVDFIHKKDQLEYLRRRIPFTKMTSLTLELDFQRLLHNAAEDRIATALQEIEASREQDTSKLTKHKLILTLYIQILEEKERSAREKATTQQSHSRHQICFQFDNEIEIVTRHDSEREQISVELEEKIKTAISAPSLADPSILIPKTPIIQMSNHAELNLCLAEQVSRSHILTDFLDEFYSLATLQVKHVKQCEDVMSTSTGNEDNCTTETDNEHQQQLPFLSYEESNYRFVTQQVEDHDYRILTETFSYYNTSIDLSINSFRDLFLEEWEERSKLTHQHFIERITICEISHPSQDSESLGSSERYQSSPEIESSDSEQGRQQVSKTLSIPMSAESYLTSIFGDNSCSEIHHIEVKSATHQPVLRLTDDSSEEDSQHDEIPGLRLAYDSSENNSHSDSNSRENETEDAFLPGIDVNVSELYYDDSLSEDDLLDAGESCNDSVESCELYFDESLSENSLGDNNSTNKDDDTIQNNYKYENIQRTNSDSEQESIIGSSEADFFFCPIHEEIPIPSRVNYKLKTINKTEIPIGDCKLCNSAVPRRVIPDVAPTWGMRSAGTDASHLIGTVAMIDFEQNCKLVRETRSKASNIKKTRTAWEMKKLLLSQQQWGFGTCESFPVKSKIELRQAMNGTKQLLNKMLRGVIQRQQTKRMCQSESISKHTETIEKHVLERLHHQNLQRTWLVNKAEISQYKIENLMIKKILRIANLPRDTLESQSVIPSQRRVNEDLELKVADINNTILRLQSKSDNEDSSAILHKKSFINRQQISLDWSLEEIINLKSSINEKNKILFETERQVIHYKESLNDVVNRNFDLKNDLDVEEDLKNKNRNQLDKSLVLISDMKREMEEHSMIQEEYYKLEINNTSPLVRMWLLQLTTVEDVEMSMRSIIRSEWLSESSQICFQFGKSILLLTETLNPTIRQQNFHLIDLIGSREAFRHHLSDVVDFLGSQTKQLKSMNPTTALNDLQLRESDDRRELMDEEFNYFIDFTVSWKKFVPISRNGQNRNPVKRNPPTATRSLLSTILVPKKGF